MIKRRKWAEYLQAQLAAGVQDAMKDWIFVDEKIFVTGTRSKRVYLLDRKDWRQYKALKTKPVKLMFFAGICPWGTPPIVKISGKMDSLGYIDMIQKQYEPWIKANGPRKVVWVHDNAKVHKTLFNLDMLRAMGLQPADRKPLI